MESDAVQPKEPSSVIVQVKSLIGKVAAKHVNYTNRRYLPAPLVGHVLNTLRDCRPNDFTPLHIIARDVRTAVASAHRDEQFVVWLPRPDQVVQEMTEELWTKMEKEERAGAIWLPEFDTDAAALIARYVAALMIGVAVSYAPRELLLDFISQTASAEWKPLIDAAFQSNGGPLMRTYVEQVRSRRAISNPSGDVDPWLVRADDADWKRWTAAERPEQVRVVGLDIGGTQLKACCYDAPNWDTPAFNHSISWPESCKIQDILHQLCEKCHKRGDCKLDALGIALAGPVMDDVPVGISKVTNWLLRGSKPEIAESTPLKPQDVRRAMPEIAAGNPLELHAISFATAARKLLDCPLTVVLNDGEADIRSSESKVRAGGEGVTLVIKEGTGVAFAVYLNGVPVDVLAETAKAVLNLRCELQNRKEDERMQQGELSERCSKKKFGNLVRVLGLNLWNGVRENDVRIEARDDVVGFLVGGLLELAVDPDQGVRGLDRQGIADRLSRNGLGGESWKRLREELGNDSLLPRFLEAVEAYKGDHDVNVKLYLHARQEMARRGRLNAIQALRKGGVPGGTPHPAPQHADYDALGEPMKAAVACAWVLGRWLADAVALACELFDAREVRLGGGPLSGKTGLFTTCSAREALQEVYGFDVRPEGENEDASEDDSSPKELPGRVRVSGHGPRAVRRVKLSFPPEESSEGGPKGAALAAFDAYLAALKLKQLRACRSWVADHAPREGEARKPFSPGEVENAVKLDTREPWLLTDVEVSNMLARESSALALTRTGDDSFVSWLARP